MFELIACSSPLKLVLLVALLSFMLGALVGAWWESRPLSDLEKRVEFNTREIDEHEEGL